MRRSAAWLEPEAHRSLRSGQARGAKAAQDLSNGRVITFLSFATSSAQIERGLFDSQHPKWQATGQIEEARKAVGNAPIDAVLLSIGGNDVGFSGGLQELAADFQGGGLDKMVRDTRRRIQALVPRFDALALRLQSLVNPRRVYITEYPTGMFDKKDLLGGPLGRRADGCEIFDSGAYMKVSSVDAAMIFELAHELNDQLRRAADQYGWTYLEGIVEGFAGHGYCTDEDERFWVRAVESCKKQGDYMGTMHPNERGHEIYQDVIASALRQQFTGGSIERSGSLEPMLHMMT
nr:GDSL-type esterase/lipase family protein [Geodermatophilus amargosae]